MVRKLEIGDMGQVLGWFYAQTGTKLNTELLSDHGFIYEGVAALFFFPVEGAKIAMFGWPITNPESSHAERTLALNALVMHVEKHARTVGFKWLTSYSSHQGVTTRMHGWGYRVGDNPVTQFVKSLEV